MTHIHTLFQFLKSLIVCRIECFSLVCDNLLTCNASIERPPRQLFASSVQLLLSVLWQFQKVSLPCLPYFLTSSCAFVRSPIWLSNITANTNNHFLFSAGNWMKHLENSRNPKKCTKDRSMRLKVEHQQQKQTLKCTCFTKLLNTRSSWSRHLLRNKQSDVIQLLYKYYGKPFTFTCSLYYVI